MGSAWHCSWGHADLDGVAGSEIENAASQVCVVDSYLLKLL